MSQILIPWDTDNTQDFSPIREEIDVADKDDSVNTRREKPHQADHRHAQSKDGAIGSGVAANPAATASITCRQHLNSRTRRPRQHSNI